MTGRQRFLAIAIVLVQFICAVFFLIDIISTTIGFSSQPLPWHIHELVEITVGVGLLIGIIAGSLLLLTTLRRNTRVEEQLRAASGAFTDLMNERFSQWQLTSAERDVAWFMVKGLSNSEIAALRSTSEGTVKAQGNAVFRKSGVSSRTQLLSLFVEDLMAESPGDQPVHSTQSP